MKRVILYGGTFDPVHKGHIEASRAAALELGADCVYLIPARRSPFKDNPPAASDSDRGKMLERAVRGEKLFCVSYTEFERSEPSYSFDTVMHFKRLLGDDAELFWLVGADTLGSLKKWYRIEEMLNNCTIAAMYRGGCKIFDKQALPGLLGKELAAMNKVVPVQTPLIDISSTQVRKRLAAGQDVSGMLAPGVLEYIKDNHLYES
ncbi:putative nicotinate-nucleotide adenylyltransferase [Limihaloglobus sulfuriphilus]|uniref:Probable nicotinate-nucleotide adenylyltransferase n=1 Tax=Limihaloglobus sulfuriphilus TaxID=1851148 RepID=A0A1Q2MEG2_9BACT|nr:nicotinate (nicotinamide) nucleotide adenylyltransferase [Limihaloglobus sulfuriphilus]AQQ71091.1 putative nicotinate-nucleotide adenylyltransferase [Limihaloglobus sulfuriphilus]